jgi:CubicO group peptidase (beta-lactamase class C family)
VKSQVRDVHRWVLVGVSLMLMLLVSLAASAATRDIQHTVDQCVKAGITPAMVVGVVRADGTMEFYSAGTLHADGTTPVDENTIFEIGSISKVFTTLLLAQMEAQGALKLSDPAQRFLPEGVTMPSRDETPITLEHLATHTSGLPRLPDNFRPKNVADPYRCYTYQQMYDFLSGHELQGQIGGTSVYSNLGTGLLGHILELQSGKTYEVLLIEQVCDPLDMTSTTTEPRAQDADRVAGGHRGGRATSAWAFPTLAGCGGIDSNARDLLRFTAANLGQIDTPLASAMRRCHEPRARIADVPVKVGLGWHIEGPAGREIIWHNGGTGGFASFLGFRPDTGEGVVVLCNSAYRGVDQIGRHVLDDRYTFFEFPKEVPVDPSALEAYVGTYALSPDHAFTVRIDNGALDVRLTGQRFLPVYPTGTDAFCYRDVEARLTFGRDAAGKVDRLILHQHGRDQQAARTN